MSGVGSYCSHSSYRGIIKHCPNSERILADLQDNKKECYIAATLLVLCLVTGSNYPVAIMPLVRSFRLLLF